MGIEPLIVYKEIYLKIFLCQYGFHIYYDINKK